MPAAWLCQIDAFARADGSAKTIRLASHDDDRLCHLNGATWWPSIERLPTLAYDFFDGAFTGDIVTPSGRSDISISAIPGFAGLMFHDASIRWWSGDLGAAWGDYVLRFDGLIDNHPAIRDGVGAMEFRVDDRWLDDPLLGTYTGAGGAEGEAAMKGQVKPFLLGAPRMVEGVLVDAIDTILQLSDGPIEAVEVAFENVQRFDAPVADYASFSALDAATIAPGYVATSKAAGLIRHGAPGAGVLTYDVRGSNSGADGGGWVRKPGALIKRLAARAGKLSKVDTAALDALDVARPWNMSLALTQQTTMREVVQAIAQSINAVALVTWTGKLTVLPIPLPEAVSAIGTLAADGTALPPVASVVQLGIAPPFWRLAIEAEITNRVHGNDEVAYYDVPVIEKTVYRRSASAPTTPTGGNFNYLTGATTPPTDWYADIGSVPAGTDPLYASSAVASRSPTSGTAPFGTWSTPGIFAQDGAPGASRYTWYAYADAPDGNFNFNPGSPGGRTYQGIAYNKTTATESTNYLDYAWAPYGGPPNFGLANFNANTVLAGNKLIKVGGSGWNGSIHSTESFKGGASVSFVVDSTGIDLVAGLNTDPTTDADWASIDFAINLTSSGNVAIIQSGSIGPNISTYAVGDVFTITYNDKFVVYSKQPAAGGAAVILGTNSSPGAGLSLFFDSSLYTANKHFGRILSFSAAGTAGADGTSPPLIFVASTHQTFRYDAAGSPVAQSTTITATRQNTAGTTEWRVSNADGSSPSSWVSAAALVTAGGASSSPNNDTLVLSHTQFQTLLTARSTNGLIYEARMSGAIGVQDRISIVKVQDGSNGTNGISPVAAVAVPASKQFAADADGTIKSAGSVLPFNVAIDATKAGATIGGTVTILAVSGCTATAISGGFTIDDVTADTGFVNWRFTASDGQVVEGKMSHSRQRDPASGAQVVVNFSSTSWWGSGSYASSGPGTVLAASSTGKLNIGGYAQFYCGANGTATLAAKLQYRLVGAGSWTDSGFTSSGSALKTADLPGEPGENSPGEVNPGGSLTGLTANAAYEIQMVASRTGVSIGSAAGFTTMKQVI